MGSEWQVYRLGDLVDIFDGPHATPAKIDTGPIFLGISNLENGRLDIDSTVHLSEEDYVKWTRRVTPQQGDVVFSYETRLGEAAIIPAELKCCLGRRMGLLRAKGSRIDPRFLLYSYLGNEFQETIRSRTMHGSTVDRIPLIEMPDFPIRIPNLETQRAIAHILGTLDDKIELNRQMNQTLEAIARALFKSWFVDFDPVRAKATGEQPPDLAPYIAGLFPDEFVESELGEIPKGWRIGILEDLIVLQRGFDLPTQNRIPGSYQVIAASGPSTYHNKAKVRGPGVVTGRSGILGKVFLVQDDFWPLNTALWVKEFKGSKPHHAYFLLQRLDFSTFNAGSAVPTLNRNHVHNLPVVLPDPKIIDRFESIAKLVFEKIRANDKESNTLAVLRDTLLPKLISGELRVPDAERIIGRCV